MTASKHFEQLTLVVVCGWAAAGKTTIAKGIEKALGIHRLDIDEVRRITAGIPHPHPEKSPELMEKDRMEMSLAYRALYFIANLNLSVGRSVIITATMSRAAYWKPLLSSVPKNLNAAQKIIQCLPKDDPREEIERRLKRDFGKEHFGGVNSYKRYLEVKNRFQPPPLSHLILDTSSPEPEAIEASIQKAIAYIQE